MSPRVGFILNARSGGGLDDAWKREHLPALQALAEGGGAVRFVDGDDDIACAVRDALATGCSTVVAGGGDGTVSAVASRLVDHPVVFGVLPLGTLNHFAKDLRIPLGVPEALATIAAGHVLSVDVGEVNGRCFVNNSSLGLYPDVVRVREHEQRRLGLGKWIAFARALARVLRHFRLLSVRLDVDGASLRPHRTPFVFVGNNVYRMTGLQIGRRDDLCDGVLSVVVADESSRWRLLVLAVRAVAGRLEPGRGVRVLTVDRLTIETRRPRLHVAIDGETVPLDTPLHYRIRPGALRVLAPPADAPPAAEPGPIGR